MNETGRRWAGQIVDGRFELGAYLGASEKACVFATEHDGQAAAIKLIHADPAQAKDHLLRWSRVASLTHPSIVRLFESGPCRIGDSELAYIVTERADEALAEILPQRSLTGKEVRDMLPPILAALAYLHEKGFAHGGIKPANILAVGDYVKISSDRISAIGTTATQSSAYDAPEVATSGCSASADVWSLGMVVMDALTQQLPRWRQSDEGDPLLPTLVPEPFAEIVRNCVRRAPQRRWSVADISSRLRESSRTTGVIPAPQGGSQEIRTPLPTGFEGHASRPGTQLKWRHFVPAAVLVTLAVGVVLLAPKIAERLQNRDNANAVVEAGPTLVHSENRPATPTAQPNTVPRSNPPSNSLPDTSQHPTAPVTPPAKMSQGESQGAVVQQVIPRVPRSALDTIQGTVRVEVRVEVSASGDVSGASIESPGPSKYFANQALKAARGWKFAPAAAMGGTGHAWILRFEFKQDGTTVTLTAVPQ